MKKRKKDGGKVDRLTSILNLAAAILNLAMVMLLVLEKLIE